MARWVWGHRAVGALSCEIHQSTMKGFESHWFPPAVGDDKPLFLPRSLLKCSPYDTGILRSDERGPRRSGPQQDNPEFTHFLPLPKPAHLIYIKPTVAVVADVAARNSVGLKMSAGDDKLERYIIEFYSKSVK
eukprot:scaffold42372_cov17-Tisochrysis_lutea.AAC.2